MTEFYLQRADKQRTTTAFPLLFREARAWTISLTRWPESRALVEKNRTSPLPIRGHKGQNSTGTRCPGFLVLETRCRGFSALESRCRGFLSSEKMSWNHDVMS